MSEIRNRATLDSTQFQSGLKGMRGSVQGLGNSLRSLPGLGAALSVGGLLAAARAAMNAADAIDNLASQTGLSIEATQAYQVALKEAGLDMGVLQGASDRLKRSQAEAITGNQKSRDSFAALGISMDDLKRADTTRLLELVGRALGHTEGDAAATAAQFDLLGRGSERLRQVLIDLNRDGIDAHIRKQKELGLVIDESAIQTLNRAQLVIERTGTKLSNFTSVALADSIDAYERYARVTEKANENQSDFNRLLLAVPFVGPIVGAVRRGGVSDEERKQIGIDLEAENTTARQAKEERQKKELESRLAGEERAANAEIEGIEEKRRLMTLSNDQLREELNLKLQSARVDLEKADGALQRLDAIRQIYDLEQQLTRIKDPITKQIAERSKEDPVSSLRRIGANAGGVVGRSEDPRLVRSWKNSDNALRVLQSIESKMQQGATF